MGKVYGREPAVWLAAVGAVWQILSAFGLGFDPQLQSIITAIVAAVLGIIVAVPVGFNWDADTQAKLVGAVMLLVAWFVTRPNVTAPVSASVSPAGKLVA